MIAARQKRKLVSKSPAMNLSRRKWSLQQASMYMENRLAASFLQYAATQWRAHFSGIVHRRFGFENVGFHLSDSVVTMDFSGVISPEDIADVEHEVNVAISKIFR